MNESPIRKFCESPHRKTIVVIATTLLGLLVLLPLVDEYFDNKATHSTLIEDLDRARQTAEELPEIERQVAEVIGKLDEIESKTISGDSVSDYRSRVVDVVRKSGCQVRRFDLSTPTIRPWLKNDNPLDVAVAQQAKNKKTPFSLERRNVVLLVDGTMESIRALLDDLNAEESLSYMHRLELHSGSRRNEQVTLEIELWLFALGRHKA